METHNNVWTLRRAPGELALTLLRVVAGITLTVHGWLKLTDVPSWQAQLISLGVPAPEITSWFAIAGEFLGGLGLIVGLLTPLAAFGGAATMVAAIALVHWGNGLLSSNGGFEFPLLLLCTALVFMLRGAGPLSVDALLRRSMQRRSQRKREADSVEQAPQARPKPKGDQGFHKPRWSKG